MGQLLLSIEPAGHFDISGAKGVLSLRACIEFSAGSYEEVPPEMSERLQRLLLGRCSDYSFYCNGIRGESPCKICRKRYGVTRQGDFGEILDLDDGTRYVEGFPEEMPYFLNSGCVVLGLLGFRLLISSRLLLHHLKAHEVVAEQEVWLRLKGLRHGGLWDWLMKHYHLRLE